MYACILWQQIIDRKVASALSRKKIQGYMGNSGKCLDKMYFFFEEEPLNPSGTPACFTEFNNNNDNNNKVSSNYYYY